jgi:hypothetical protein
MCNYSLHAENTREARIADKLVTKEYETDTTRGFADCNDSTIAVCLRPGTELAFETNVEYDNFVPFLPRRRAAWNTARFRQIRLNEEFAHHDALELPDGSIVLLTRLCEGQRANVLQLPASTSGTNEQSGRQDEAVLA